MAKKVGYGPFKRSHSSISRDRDREFRANRKERRLDILLTNVFGWIGGMDLLKGNFRGQIRRKSIGGGGGKNLNV